MAKWVIGKELEEYLQELQKLEKNSPEIIGKAVYNMADIVADEVKKGIESLPAVPDAEGLKAYQAKESPPLTYSQKKGLLDSFGITRMQEDDGYYHVKLGFDGYNNVKTKTYPKGQPNVLIARVTESGSSIKEKHPFIRPAVRRARKRALLKAQEIIEEEINAL